MKVAVKRVVYLNEVSELDLNNLGNHFTKNNSYTHKGGGANGVTLFKKIKCSIRAMIEESLINKEATLLSNNEYPHECEVVTFQNSEILVYEISYEFHADRLPMKFDNEPKKANTGSRIDKWVETL